MRTNIDNALIHKALKASGLKTKKDGIEVNLKTLITLKKQESIRALKGKLHWEGNLDEYRTDR